MIAADDKKVGSDGCQNGWNGACFAMAVQMVKIVFAMAVKMVKLVTALQWLSRLIFCGDDAAKRVVLMQQKEALQCGKKGGFDAAKRVVSMQSKG